jgi:hypothetical protein
VFKCGKGINLNELNESIYIKLLLFFDKNISLFTPDKDLAKGMIDGLLESEEKYARISIIPIPLLSTKEVASSYSVTDVGTSDEFGGTLG